LFEVNKWHQDLRVNNTLKALKKNGFEAVYVSDKKTAVSKVLNSVSLNALVGLGGSVTLREMDLPEILKARGNEVADHWEARQRGASHEEMLKIERLHINSDVFITSTNAVTETGKLINVDGGGQRVAAMIFGPKKVVIIAGINKIVSSVEDGIERVNNVAAPMNAKRLNLKTPCTVTGVCTDCGSEERICNITSIIHRRPKNTNVVVLLVGEDLGY
jgi:L-lactate utilization protein LutB